MNSTSLKKSRVHFVFFISKTPVSCSAHRSCQEFSSLHGENQAAHRAASHRHSTHDARQPAFGIRLVDSEHPEGNAHCMPDGPEPRELVFLEIGQIRVLG